MDHDIQIKMLPSHERAEGMVFGSNATVDERKKVSTDEDMKSGRYRFSIETAMDVVTKEIIGEKYCCRGRT